MTCVLYEDHNTYSRFFHLNTYQATIKLVFRTYDMWTLRWVQYSTAGIAVTPECGPYSRVQYSMAGTTVTPECGPYSRVQYSTTGTAVTPECGPYSRVQ